MEPNYEQGPEAPAAPGTDINIPVFHGADDVDFKEAPQVSEQTESWEHKAVEDLTSDERISRLERAVFGEEVR